MKSSLSCRITVLLVLALAASLPGRAQETYQYVQRDSCALYLDIWRPAAGAVTSLDGVRKPAILFVFGGGFIQGSRNDKFYHPWFKRLTDEGYTVISIDYRLGMKGYKVGKGLLGAYKASSQFLLAQQLGVEDVFSAVSFLDENREELDIDTKNLVLSGCSAGAIISLASAYAIANGQTEGLPEGFGFKGVMSFAGAIISTSGKPVFKNAPCPLLLLHGTADAAVAYDHFGAFGRGIWGSSYLYKQLSQKGWPASIWRFEGNTHDVAVYMDYVWPIEQDFLEKDVMQGVARHIDATVQDPSLPVWFSVSLDDIYKP